MCLTACEGNIPDSSPTKDGFVDLGLTSGTKWKNTNEYNKNNTNGFYTYSEAVELFKDSLPTQKQWEELIKECTWEWKGKGYRVTGNNGNYITLPADGYRFRDGHVDDVGTSGFYWSSTHYKWDYAWSLEMYSSGQYSVEFRDESWGEGQSVRLAIKP